MGRRLGGSYALLLLTYSLIGRWFAKHPKGSAISAGIAAVVFVAGQYASGNENIASLTLWFWVAASAIVNGRRFAYLKYALDFRNWFFTILVVWVYLSSLFGNIRSELGGGAPTPAVLYLERPLPLLDSTTAAVALLDETDQGFYVLPPGKKKALFVPRGDVSSIYYGLAQDVPNPR